MIYSAENHLGKRLDSAVCDLDDKISRSMAQKLIEKGKILVNDQQKKANYKLKTGDSICIEHEEEQSFIPLPKDIPLNVVYEDEFLAVINKPRGMVVHPGAGHFDDTLVNALLFRFDSLSTVGGQDRPGIVHRIDKDTSGLILIAKDDKTHLFLSDQLRDKTMNRRYLAVCKGNFSEDVFVVEKNITRHKTDRKKMTVCDKDEGRYAKTEFRVLGSSKNYTLLECRLFTGRTHQIRVHLASMGHSLLGDLVYGKKGKVHFDGQALHAFSLEFIHPKTLEKMCFYADVPQEFYELLKKLSLQSFI